MKNYRKKIICRVAGICSGVTLLAIAALVINCFAVVVAAPFVSDEMEGAIAKPIPWLAVIAGAGCTVVIFPLRWMYVASLADSLEKTREEGIDAEYIETDQELADALDRALTEASSMGSGRSPVGKSQQMSKVPGRCKSCKFFDSSNHYIFCGNHPAVENMKSDCHDYEFADVPWLLVDDASRE